MKDMAGMDKQHIKDLIAQGNRFEAMNIFLQCKFGKPENASSGSAKVKNESTEASVPNYEEKNKTDAEKSSENKDNSESDSDVSEGGSESETSGVSQVSSPAPRSEVLVPEVELKEDENFDVDVETVDPLSEDFLPRPQVIEQSGSMQMMQPQPNLQGSKYSAILLLGFSCHIKDHRDSKDLFKLSLSLSLVLHSLPTRQ